MIELTVDKVIQALENAVEENGHDFIYTNIHGQSTLDESGNPITVSCQYVHGDIPGCLGGTALHALGVSLDEMEPYEGEPVDVVLEHLTVCGILSYDRNVRLLLSRAQDQQDRGICWGDAVISAKELIKNI